MSGHSKWATIHRQKSLTDTKRGAIFTKLTRNITLAAKQGGGDPEMNPSLRSAIEKAKEFNMPKENVERAIKRGTGELEGMHIEEVTYEAFGPEGTALIIKCITDNKNRTASNMRHILTKNGGRFGEPNSVIWMFEQQGVIRTAEIGGIGNFDDLELKVIDAGARDIKREGSRILIFTAPKNLQKIKNALENVNIKIDSSMIEWVAKNEVSIKDEAKIKKFLDELDEDEDVQEVYSNIKG